MTGELGRREDEIDRLLAADRDPEGGGLTPRELEAALRSVEVPRAELAAAQADA